MENKILAEDFIAKLLAVKGRWGLGKNAERNLLMWSEHAYDRATFTDIAARYGLSVAAVRNNIIRTQGRILHFEEMQEVA